MNQFQTERWVGRVMWLLMFTPLITLIFFLTLALHLRIGLGYWPTYDSGAYATAGFQFHERSFTGFTCFTIWGAIPLWLTLVCVRRFRPAWSWRVVVCQAIVYLAGWILIAVFTTWNPGRMMDWYLD